VNELAVSRICDECLYTALLRFSTTVFNVLEFGCTSNILSQLDISV